MIAADLFFGLLLAGESSDADVARVGSIKAFDEGAGGLSDFWVGLSPGKKISKAHIALAADEVG